MPVNTLLVRIEVRTSILLPSHCLAPLTAPVLLGAPVSNDSEDSQRKQDTNDTGHEAAASQAGQQLEQTHLLCGLEDGGPA